MGYPLLYFTNGWIMIILTRNRLVRKKILEKKVDTTSTVQLGQAHL